MNKLLTYSIFHLKGNFNWIYAALFLVLLITQSYISLILFTILLKMNEFISYYEMNKGFKWVHKYRYLYYLFMPIFLSFFTFQMIMGDDYLIKIGNLLILLTAIYLFYLHYKTLSK